MTLTNCWWFRHPVNDTNWDISNSPGGIYNGINYQPQLVSRISELSTVSFASTKSLTIVGSFWILTVWIIGWWIYSIREKERFVWWVIRLRVFRLLFSFQPTSRFDKNITTVATITIPCPYLCSHCLTFTTFDFPQSKCLVDELRNVWELLAIVFPIDVFQQVLIVMQHSCKLLSHSYVGAILYQ